MHRLRILSAALFLFCAGCADSPFDYANRDMIPLDGVGERPNVRNRFPASRGGLPLSRADEENRDTWPPPSPPQN